MTDNFNKLHYVSFRKGLSSYDILTEISYNEVLLNYATRTFQTMVLLLEKFLMMKKH